MTIKSYEGHLQGKGIKVGIVISRFNEFISTKLLGGANDALIRHGILEEDVEIAWVPGAFEIPIVAQKMASSSKYDTVICLGCIIRGATPHFDFVAAESAKGIAAISMKTECPVMYGVLTTDTIEQAIERSGTKAGNKGWDVAIGAIEMVNLLKSF